MDGSGGGGCPRTRTVIRSGGGGLKGASGSTGGSRTPIDVHVPWGARGSRVLADRSRPRPVPLAALGLVRSPFHREREGRERDHAIIALALDDLELLVDGEVREYLRGVALRPVDLEERDLLRVTEA